MGLIYESSADATQANRQSAFLARVTVEHALYALIFLVAGLFRLGDLGVVPLSPAEALEALAVWDLWNPPDSLVTVGSPAYVTATSILVQVLGFGDPVMRLAPAAFGLALVLLPWFLRHRLGRIGALLTSLLLAISPSIVLFSRTAGGESIALFAGMLLFISWLRYQETGSNRWFYTLSASVALGLAAAPLFLGVAVTFALAWLAQASIGPPIFATEDGKSRLPHRPDRKLLVQALIIGAGLWLIVGSAFLLNASGLGASADLVALWLARFAGNGAVLVRLSPILAVGRYEIILLIAGGIALVWAAVRARPYTTFLVYWLFAALLLTLLQPGEMSNLLIMTLPGFQLIGRLADHILRRDSGPYKWPVIAFVLLAGAIVYFNLVRYSRQQFIPGGPAGEDGLILLALVVGAAALTVPIVRLIGRLAERWIGYRGDPYTWPVIGILVLSATVILVSLTRYGNLSSSALGASVDESRLLLLNFVILITTIVIVLIWIWRPPVARQGLLAGLLILLLTFTWGKAWQLSRQAAADTRERIVGTASAEDLRLLAKTAEELSWRAAGSPTDLRIVSDIDVPALRWYMREFPNLEFASALPATLDSPALLTKDESNPLLQESYVGADFGYLRPEMEHLLSPQEGLRWWLFHESPVTVDEERLVLWLRADLAGGER